MNNTLQGRKKDRYGQVIFDSSGIFNLLYSGNTHIGGLTVQEEEETKLFNKFSKLYDKADDSLEFYDDLGIPVEEFDKECINQWFIPDEYKKLDLYSYLKPKCKTNEELKRFEYELTEFKQQNLIQLLQFLIYLVDVMREHNIVWGVGRGSSVASFTLYLIGINKINPLKFNINFDEFLK